MRNITILFSCFITVLVVAFADMRPAFADHGVTAQEASEMGTMQAMKDFVLNVKATGRHSVLATDMRNSATP